MDPAVVARIDACLGEAAQEHGVIIPWAIESGSRAWGFPSPDSDYDCRFVFVRPVSQFLTLWPPRDVIETPMDGVLDVNGWELGKALKLMLKGNAVIIEWLVSPIVYAGDAPFRDEFLALARRVVDRGMVMRHYLHLGRHQRVRHFADAAEVPIKKLFYALRPAAALRWMRLHPQDGVAPMHFPTLMAECEPPAILAALGADLLAKKAVTHELGRGPVPTEILNFIDAELAQPDPDFPYDPELRDWRGDEAERFFIDTTRRLTDAG